MFYRPAPTGQRRPPLSGTVDVAPCHTASRVREWPDSVIPAARRKVQPMSQMQFLDLAEVTLAYRVDGDSPDAVVLLHGWPQTSLCWRHVIPLLAERFTVIAPDLRGYGASRPKLGATFDKRSAAEDIGALVGHLRFDRVNVAGHDRGARVAHRWALDRPRQVSRLALLDILPMRNIARTFDLSDAKSLWHWLFHLQPDLPEILLTGHVEQYVRQFLAGPVAKGAIDQPTFEHYVRALDDPTQMHATLEDYRCGFGIDLQRDELDYSNGCHLKIPLLVLWGADGALDTKPVLDVWCDYATASVTGHAVANCGHYLPEEQPIEVAAKLSEFFLAASGVG
jgi:haloacetate dehalogenase